MTTIKRILFLISLPDTQEFRGCAEMVNTSLSYLRRMGVVIRECITRESMTDMDEFDLVIAVAHYDDGKGVLVLADKEMEIKEFVESIPSGFKGILDFSSCRSSYHAEMIKRRCPECHVLGAIERTALAVRLLMYPHVVSRLRKGEKGEYREICGRVLDEIYEKKRAKEKEVEGESRATKLGSVNSSVYAPKCVKREDPYIVQVILHSKKETGEVMLVAQNVQEGAEEMGGGIRLCLKKGDYVRVNISFIGKGTENIEVADERTLTAKWDNAIRHFRFTVTVGEGFEGDGFITKIKIEVNAEPEGECMFQTKVKNEKNEMPSEIEVRQYDKEGEQKKDREEMVKFLQEKANYLRELISQCKDTKVEGLLKREEDICRKCLELILSNNAEKKETKRVFVSSTSDLKPFRDIARDVIISKGLTPEMYETWGQKPIPPRDECCRMVLESDVVMCILGSRYGYVEDMWNLSMTELEYKVAKLSGKKILVFISENKKSSDEEMTKKERQQELIKTIRDNRILSEFKDKTTFEEKSRKDLEMICKND